MPVEKKKPEEASATEEMIRKQAYHIWEREGHPSDRAMDHWLEAEKKAGARQSPQPAGATRGAKRSTSTVRAKSTTKTTRQTAAAKKKAAKKTAKKPTRRTKKS
jgi:hypothetical protein